MHKIAKTSLFFSFVVALSSTGVNANPEPHIPASQGVITALPELSSSAAPAATVKTDSLKTQSGITPFAAAPALSSMWIYAVGSSNCGWEYTAGLSATPCDHGGTQLRTAVLEIGYGSSRIAWMNGGIVGSPYATTPVCVTGGYYSWPCTAGQTVVGFLVEYNVDGHQNGLFRYQNTSSNSPWNTMSAQISIL